MKAKRLSDIATVTSLTALIIAIMLLWILVPQNNIAEEENRKAAEFPRLSAKSLWEGDFFEGISSFLSDSFPLRSYLTSLNASLKLAMGEREANGVFYTKDESLIFKGEYESLDIAEKNANAINDLSNAFSSPVTVAIVPRACDVNADKLPSIYSQERASEVYRLLDRTIPSATETRNSLFVAISKANQGFYRTDHHLTAEGAYLAYRSIIYDIGLTPCGKEFFTEEVVSTEFFGTAYSRSSIRFVSPDTVTLYRYEGDDAYTIATDTKQIKLYDLSALERKDKYQVFLGGNYGHLTIAEKGDLERPRLLLIKDSFANAIIPFLALHFDLEVVDPRYCTQPITEMIEAEEYEQILFLFGADTLATTAMYNKIG